MSILRIPVFKNGFEHVMLLDEEDWQLFHKWSICIAGKGYAKTNKTGFIHRAVMGLEAGDKRVIDHVDGDRLNNSKANLRVVTPGENNHFIKRKRRSPFRGVWALANGRFKAYISVNNRQRYLGTFDTAEKAGRVYDETARELYGGKAVINFE